MKDCLIHSLAQFRQHSGPTETGRKKCPRLLEAKLTCCAMMTSAVAIASGQNAAPSARDIVAGVRLQQSQQQLNLRGQLRYGATVVPFRLVQNGPLVRYIFSDPDETLQLRLGDNDSRMEEVSPGGTEKVTPAEYNHKVRGTPITYEDLALKFLYWADPKITGEDSILTRSCWKIETHSPGRASQYSSVNLWVEKASGALMRVDGYDWNGQLFKRFIVVSAQQIEGKWFLKQMRIEEFQPGTNKVVARSYLEINR
jgi:hypothetical protein